MGRLGPKTLNFGFSFSALLATARTFQSRVLRVPACLLEREEESFQDAPFLF